MPSWTRNTTCPLCGEDVDGYDRIGALDIPAISFDPPLLDYGGKTLHWSCFVKWPTRPTLVKAYRDWVVLQVGQDPSHGVAFEDDDTLIIAPRDERSRSGIEILLKRYAQWWGLAAEGWPQLLEESRLLAGTCYHVHRDAILRAIDVLQSRLPSPRAVIDAVDWKSKPEGP